MSSRFTELVIDCHDQRRLAEFWSGVLDYRIVDANAYEVEIAVWERSAEGYRTEPRPPSLLFLTVPEGKTVKNRMHIDVSPVDRTRDEEVDRLLALGARHVDIGQGDQSWVVLADPEGNEFCVLRAL